MWDWLRERAATQAKHVWRMKREDYLCLLQCSEQLARDLAAALQRIASLEAELEKLTPKKEKK